MTTKTNEWEKEFDDIVKNTRYTEYMSGGRFCCGGDYCESGHNEWIKNYIRTLLTQKDKETSLAVEKERERIARAMIEASILDEDDVIEEDFEGVSRVDAFMAGITHMHNAFRTILSPHSDTLEHNE